jgi:pyruvate/2-oxoglutarate dehydrogenase complex dihydrolipoamide dehydrogenase (E3) component
VENKRIPTPKSIERFILFQPIFGYGSEAYFMERFDVLVIGTGSGMLVASAAVDRGFRTAVVDFGPMGGTCTNRGCIPSKMLIYPSDVSTMIREAGKLE